MPDISLAPPFAGSQKSRAEVLAVRLEAGRTEADREVAAPVDRQVCCWFRPDRHDELLIVMLKARRRSRACPPPVHQLEL